MPFELDKLFAAWREWLFQMLIILTAGIWAFSPAFVGGWIWDDEGYISRNPIIHNPAAFWKVWVTPEALGNYYPLTTFVQWLLWQYAGNFPLVYHLTTVALHLTSALLLWRLLERLGLRFAWLGGLLFAIHPIMVESVAWISELKNTLALPPILMAMILWLKWEKEGRRSLYLWALAWFVVSLLAKTSGLMLPVILLGHAWWKRGKISWNDVRASLPFFAITLVAGLVTLTVHSNPGDTQDHQMEWMLPSALAATGWSILFCLGKSLFPIDLLPAYPGFAKNALSPLDFYPWIALAIMFALLWRARSGWGRHVLFGLGFFLVNLVPALMYVVMKYSAMIWSMDHLVYLPIIGLIGLITAGIGYLEEHLRAPWRAAERVVVVIVAALMIWESHTYSGWWVSPDVIWSRLLERDPHSWLAEQNFGHTLMYRGRYAKALAFFQKELAFWPDESEAHFDRAEALEMLGQSEASWKEYEQVVKLNPAKAKAYIKLADNLEKSGRKSEALAQYERAAKIVPDSAQLRYDFGCLLLGSGNLPAAIEQLEAAAKLDPGFAPLHENLGSALAQSGHIPEAIDQFKQVLQIDPNNAKARESLAKLQHFEMQPNAPGQH